MALSRFLALLPLALASWSPVHAQNSGGGRNPNELPTAPPPHLLPQRFNDPGLFSRYSTLYGFERFSPGERVEDAIGIHGLRLYRGRGRGPAPSVWQDMVPRCFPPSGRIALGNAGELEAVHDPRRASRQDMEGYALTATLELPINRFGFELRKVDPGDLNVIVHVLSGNRELGTVFYEVRQRFQFIGVQCAEPFDEVRIEFANPSEAQFSLDNLRHELDLRDSDRDGWPDFTDLCPDIPGANPIDSDGDGLGDACDPFPFDPENDVDGDGLARRTDNCPLLYNPDQRDSDGDGIGDACDTFPLGSDLDGDGVGDEQDNCPTTFNPEQADCDSDGVGDVCDPTLVSPSEVRLALRPGECATVTKSVCLPPSPPMVDVAIVFDTTASMGGEMTALRQNLVSFVNGVRQRLPLSDIRFALVTFKDYAGTYSSCGYSASYGRPGEVPFRVAAPIGSSDLQIVQAVAALTPAGGDDAPEAYTRALWEITQPDSGVGFRPGAAPFVMLVGDAPPHDCGLALGLGGCIPRLSSGLDPGRDGLLFTGDDLDWQDDALRRLARGRVPVLMIYSGNPAGICAWNQWCGLTGGTAILATSDGVLPPGTDLVRDLVNLIRIPVVDSVTYSAQNPCGLDIRFDPPSISGPIDVSLGARITFTETICAPAELPPGTTSLECAVNIFADDVLLGVQTIHLELGCDTYVLDFETEDDFATRLVNGQGVSSPQEFGRRVAISSAGANLGPATFDSTPGGPNDPSVNSDMLIGHGNLLLLQDSRRPQESAPGVFRVPTDDPDGGDLIFDFLSPAEPQSLLLADINPPPNLGASVTLFDSRGRTRRYTVEPGWTGTYGNAGPHRLDLTTLLPQPGNGTPRFATAAQSKGYAPDDVVRIVVHLTGYGAVDELIFCQ